MILCSKFKINLLFCLTARTRWVHLHMPVWLWLGLIPLREGGEARTGTGPRAFSTWPWKPPPNTTQSVGAKTLASRHYTVPLCCPSLTLTHAAHPGKPGCTLVSLLLLEAMFWVMQYSEMAVGGFCFFIFFKCVPEDCSHSQVVWQSFSQMKTQN